MSRVYATDPDKAKGEKPFPPGARLVQADPDSPHPVEAVRVEFPGTKTEGVALVTRHVGSGAVRPGEVARTEQVQMAVRLEVPPEADAEPKAKPHAPAGS